MPALSVFNVRSWALAFVACLYMGSGFAQSSADVQRLNALGKGLEALGRSMAEDERRNAERQRIEDERLRRQQTQEQAAKAAAEAQQQREGSIARENWRQTITPPSEYAGRISIHRQVFLDSEKNPKIPSPDFEVPSSAADISLMGRWLAYVDQSGELKLIDPKTKSERTLRAGLKNTSSIYFVDEDSLIVSHWSGDIGPEWIDIQGNTLKKFLNAASGVFPVTHSSGRYVLHTKFWYDPNEKKHFCDGAALYSTKGQLIDNVDAPDSRECAARVTDDGRLELLISKQGPMISGETIVVYRAGVQVASFDGDNRPVDEKKLWVKTTQWLGTSPYAVSYAGIPISPRVWDVSQGKMVCDLTSISRGDYNQDSYAPTGRLLVDRAGVIYVNNPAQRLNIQGCQLNNVSSGNETLSINEDLAYLHDRQSGRLDILDIASWKIRHTIQTNVKISSDSSLRLSNSWLSISGNPKVVLGNVNFYNAKKAGLESRSILIDLESGAVREPLPPFNRVSSGYLVSYEKGKRARFWKITMHENSQADKFIASLQKDKFESTADYKARVARLTLPYRLNVALHDYDADAGAFSGSWNGAPIRLPLVPADARLFAQVPGIEVQGDLAWLGGDFLELRNPSVTTPDGRRIALKVTSGPAPAVKPVVNVRAPMGGLEPQPAMAAAQSVSPVSPVSASAQDLGSDCKTAETRGMAQIEDIRRRAAGGRLGACESARLNRRVGEIGLAVYTVCRSQEGIDSMKQMIRETDATIRGVCG